MKCPLCKYETPPGILHYCEVKADQASLRSPVRPSWDQYFMSLAVTASTRSTCSRKHVGAVLVRDRNTLSTGYNGSIRGTAHCDDSGHMMEDGHCVRVIHAEMNAIIQAAKNGISIDGASCYCTASPCWSCFKALANAGIVDIYYKEEYRLDERVLEAATALSIKIECIGEE